MPTGAGTRTIVEGLLENILKNDTFNNQNSIVWLAHTEELCEQAIDTFKYVWQNLAPTSAQIVRCWGTYKPTPFDVIGSFVVGTFQKFSSYSNKQSDVYSAIIQSCQYSSS